MPRPKAFDPAEKLDEAMDLFWRQGYSSTSIPQLEEQLNINRFSIYATYGDKRTLFRSVLLRYRDELILNLLVPLESGTEGLADLKRFYATFRRQLGGGGVARGCLLCNTATELGDSDAEFATVVGEYFDRLESALTSCLRRARGLGEITANDAELRNRATLLRLSVQGLLVQLRLNDTSADARRELRAMNSIVQCLRPA